MAETMQLTHYLFDASDFWLVVASLHEAINAYGLSLSPINFFCYSFRPSK
jgi:hypothetical protein